MSYEYFRRTGCGRKVCLQTSAIKRRYQPNLHSKRNIQLHSRQAQKITMQARTGVKVREGICWLTIQDQLEDVILQPGQVWIAFYKTEILLSALGEQTCELEIGEFVPVEIFCAHSIKN